MVVVVFIFRRVIGNLIRTVTQLRYGSFEVNFKRELAELESQAQLNTPPPAERAHRRRVQALEHRLSSLTMPPPLRRALSAATSQLRDARPETAAQVLSQLVAPARDSGGTEAGEALALAAKQAREVGKRVSG